MQRALEARSGMTVYRRLSPVGVFLMLPPMSLHLVDAMSAPRSPGSLPSAAFLPSHGT